MPEDAKAKARKAARRAQSDFERAQQNFEQLRDARRMAFEAAKSSGLSMRDIASETGLHFTRVAQILRKD